MITLLWLLSGLVHCQTYARSQEASGLFAFSGQSWRMPLGPNRAPNDPTRPAQMVALARVLHGAV